MVAAPMSSPPNLRLNLANREANLTLAIGVVHGIADLLGLDDLARDALQTATGEAVKNVILHAYDGAEGPLELEVAAQGDALAVTVRDHGIGIRPRLGERRTPHTGIGMPIMHLLSRRVTYTNVAGGGTEVCMELALDASLGQLALEEQDRGSPFPEDVEMEAAVELEAAPQQLARFVLPRLLDALAVREGLAGDEAQTLRTLGELLVERHGAADDRRLCVRIEPAASSWTIWAAPFEASLGGLSGVSPAPAAPARPPGRWPAQTVALSLAVKGG